MHSTCVFSWLLQDRKTLSTALADYFNEQRLNPDKTPNKADAFAFQGHVILHLLNDNVIPVVR